MADFNFKDWLKFREQELPSLLSKQRKRFDLTPNTWMEDPEIWNKAKTVAGIDPKFAKFLQSVNDEGVSILDDPKYTDEFINRLNNLSQNLM